LKIYDDDPLVPYKNTKIGANQTKAEIDGLLARWGIKTAEFLPQIQLMLPSGDVSLGEILLPRTNELSVMAKQLKALPMPVDATRGEG